MITESTCGQHSHASESCRYSDYRRTGCPNWTRPDLWGAWTGDRWAYPEADGPVCHGLCGAQPAPSRPAAKRNVGCRITVPKRKTKYAAPFIG